MRDKLEPNSLRKHLDLVILAMGLFAFAFVFFSGESYLRLAIDAQRAELVNRLRLETNEFMDGLSRSSHDLAVTIRQDQRLFSAFQSADTAKLTSILDEQYKNYILVPGPLKIAELQIVDSSFIEFARVVGTGYSDNSTVATCPGLPYKVTKEMGKQQTKPEIFFCNFPGRPLIASILPINPQSDGYVIVISDLAHSLLALEATLGMPLTIALRDGTVIHEPVGLKDIRKYDFSVTATHNIKDGAGRTALTISMHPDLTAFIGRLQQMRNFIMLLMSALLIVAFLYLRKMIASLLLNPIQSLSEQLRSSITDSADTNNEKGVIGLSEGEEPWELRELYGALHDMAITDTLTGLANRKQFERLLKPLVDDAKTSGIEHVLCYLDLDQFKVINEACGHLGGDEFLRTVAELLRSKIRDRDIIARLGGDEFGLVLQDCSLTKAVEIANKLLESIKEHKFVWEEQRFHMGASIGLVLINSDNCEFSALLSSADSACYAAKEAGRNRIQIFQERDEVLTKRQGEIQWVTRINTAVEEDLFQLLYQAVVPIVPKKDAKLGCELLLRMLDDNGASISPGVFMPAAERYGLMPALDRWVIRSVFAWLDMNPDALNHFDVFFVNISSQSLGDENFLDYVKEQLAQYSISPKQICFEVTETAAITDIGRIKEFAGQISQMGFRISLDHFGTGVSSFCYLKTLPVDFLKIDGSFVKDMLNSTIDRAIVRSILDVGKTMGIETIAEHVENHDILMALQEIGVDYAQGYGILPPHKLSELGKGLSDNDSLVIEPEEFSAAQN